MNTAQALITAGLALAGVALWTHPAAAASPMRWLLTQDLSYSLETLAKGDAVADDDARVVGSPRPDAEASGARTLEALPPSDAWALALLGFGGVGAAVLGYHAGGSAIGSHRGGRARD